MGSGAECLRREPRLRVAAADHERRGGNAERHLDRRRQREPALRGAGHRGEGLEPAERRRHRHPGEARRHRAVQERTEHRLASERSGHHHRHGAQPDGQQPDDRRRAPRRQRADDRRRPERARHRNRCWEQDDHGRGPGHPVGRLDGGGQRRPALRHEQLRGDAVDRGLGPAARCAAMGSEAQRLRCEPRHRLTPADRQRGPRDGRREFDGCRQRQPALCHEPDPGHPEAATSPREPSASFSGMGRVRSRSSPRWAGRRRTRATRRC